MRVFVTGASGHIGSAVLPELLAAGHQVIALARSDASAFALEQAGAQVRRGTLDDFALLRDLAAESEGVIHLAYKHELALSGAPDGFARAAEQDLHAIKAMTEPLVGTGKPFVGTSGSMLLTFSPLGRTGTEDDALAGGPRIDSENAVVALAQRGVRSSVVRLAPSVHSSLDTHGFVPSLIEMARKNGFAAYVGEGDHRWPGLHTLDAAVLYRLALEKAPAGSRLHGVDEVGVPFREIALAIGRGLGLPAKSVSPAEAPKYLGFLAHFAASDNPTSNTRTRELLDWKPTRPGLLADIAEGHYFARD